MTTMTRCPACGNKWLHTVWEENGVYWKRCAHCRWDERHQLREKIKEEIANGDGADADARPGA